MGAYLDIDVDLAALETMFSGTSQDGGADVGQESDIDANEFQVELAVLADPFSRDVRDAWTDDQYSEFDFANSNIDASLVPWDIVNEFEAASENQSAQIADKITVNYNAGSVLLLHIDAMPNYNTGNPIFDGLVANSEQMEWLIYGDYEAALAVGLISVGGNDDQGLDWNVLWADMTEVGDILMNIGGGLVIGGTISTPLIPDGEIIGGILFVGGLAVWGMGTIGGIFTD